VLKDATCVWESKCLRAAGGSHELAAFLRVRREPSRGPFPRSGPGHFFRSAPVPSAAAAGPRGTQLSPACARLAATTCSHMALKPRHDKGRRLRGGALSPPLSSFYYGSLPSTGQPPTWVWGGLEGGGWTARGSGRPIKGAAAHTVAIIRWPNSVVS